MLGTQIGKRGEGGCVETYKGNRALTGQGDPK